MRKSVRRVSVAGYILLAFSSLAQAQFDSQANSPIIAPSTQSVPDASTEKSSSSDASKQSSSINADFAYQRDDVQKLAPAIEEIVSYDGPKGLSLPAGYRFVTVQSMCNLAGRIEGPDGFAISYSQWTPLDSPDMPRHSGHYNDADGTLARFPNEAKLRYVNGELLELAVLGNRNISASFPGLGVHMATTVRNPQEFADAITIILSIPNSIRRVSWNDAKVLMADENLRRVSQNKRKLELVMADGANFVTQQPQKDAFAEVLENLGRPLPNLQVENVD